MASRQPPLLARPLVRLPFYWVVTGGGCLPFYQSETALCSFVRNVMATAALVRPFKGMIWLFRDMMEGKQQHSWSSRTDKLFFRGAKTGNRAWLADDSAFMAAPAVDVKFAGWTGDPSVPFASLAEHCDYRLAWARVPSWGFCGSCLAI